MTPQAAPQSEAERLKALWAYDILDTGPEAAFDRIARLAAALTGTPIALVTLVDERRVWFKAALGLDVREVPREQSFCNQAIVGDQALVIEDTRADPRFADTPAVLGPPHVRFYAGTPLRSRSGHTVGALCVIDREPRQLEAGQIARLDDLAESVIDALELRLAVRQSQAEADALRATQQALAASEARYRSVLDTAVDAILTMDRRGRIDSANAACLRLFGYQPEELIGQDIGLLMPRSEVAHHDKALARYDRTRSSRIVNGPVREVTARCKDGTLLSIHLAVSEAMVAGEPIFTGIIRDITEQRAVQAELLNTLSLMHAVVDSSEDPIFIKDLDGRYLLVNSACAKAIGHPPEKILGRCDTDLLPAEVVARLRAIDQTVASSGRTVSVEERLPAAAGGTATYLSTKSPLIGANGMIAGVVGIARDITARKANEEAMVQAKEAADHANSAKTEFLSAMSHELRTPLNAVLGFSQMLEINERKEPLTPTQRRCVEHIHRAGSHLLELINEILDLAKIETGRLSLQIDTVDAREVLLESLALVTPMAEPAGVAIRFTLPSGPPIQVLADHTRLKQVLVNLLSNAIKYNRRGGLVTIAESIGPGRLRLTVTDTGRGIAPGCAGIAPEPGP